MVRNVKQSSGAPNKKAKHAAPPPTLLKSALKNSQAAAAKRKSANIAAVPVPIRKQTVADAKPVLTKHAKGKGKAIDHGDSEEESKRTLPSTFKVIAGSYEKLLYGLEGTFTDENGNPSSKPRLKPIFIFPAHVSCVKAAAASPMGGKWLATGSTDEIVKVWDLRRLKEIGGLMQHEGSITYLHFPSRSHLVSASEDGTICIFHTRDWVLLRTLKGHKDRVNSVAVHPSGKVGLSVGKDRTLRMWDLMHGKGVASTKLGKEGEVVRWSTKGDRFVVLSRQTIDLYSSEMKLLHTITHPSRIHDVRFVRRVDDNTKELLLIAAEDKKVTIYDAEGDDALTLPVLGELVGHKNRVKALDVLPVALSQLPDSGTETGSQRAWTTLLCTVSSDGWIRIFNLADLPSSPAKVELTAVAEYDTKGTRLTCCALADGEALPSGAANRKRKRALDEDGNGAQSDVSGGSAAEGEEVKESAVEDEVFEGFGEEDDCEESSEDGGDD